MQKLVETVLQEAAVTDAVMASCFEEMDADHSGTIEWCAPSLLVPGQQLVANLCDRAGCAGTSSPTSLTWRRAACSTAAPYYT